jgi:hypothetical protein
MFQVKCTDLNEILSHIAEAKLICRSMQGKMFIYMSHD